MKTDHIQFFSKFAFLVRIDAEFTVEFNGRRKKVPRLSYGLKIVHGSPLSQFTIFQETERFARTHLNVQCFSIRSVSYRVVSYLNGFAGKESQAGTGREVARTL